MILQWIHNRDTPYYSMQWTVRTHTYCRILQWVRVYAMQYVQGSVQDVQCIILQSRICNAWYCKAQSALNKVLKLLIVSLCVSIWSRGTPHQCRAQPVKLSLSNCFCIGRQFPSGTNCPHILGIKLHKNNKGPKNRILTRPSSVCASHSETKRHRTK